MLIEDFNVVFYLYLFILKDLTLFIDSSFIFEDFL